MKGGLVVILLVFVTAILLNVMILSEGFATANGKDGKCFRRKGDKCTKQTVGGVEGCYDSMKVACDPDCCESSATVVTNLGKDDDADKTSGLDSLFDTLLSTYKPEVHDYANSSKNSSNDSANCNTSNDYSHRNQDEIDKVYDELSDEAKKSKLDKIRSILRSDIQKAVKDELLASRSTNPVDTTCSGTSSPALEQGSCFRGASTDSSAPNATIPYAVGQQTATADVVKPFDMSQYIRKDSIPCYACTLPQ